MAVVDLVPVSISFRGPHQTTKYKTANDAALSAGWQNARRNGRHRWNLEDFDVAKAEFNRMMDNLTLGMEEERGA